MIRNVGILGTGLWEGHVVENREFDARHLSQAPAKDPYRGRRGDDGAIRIAGLELTTATHPRTIAAIERSFRDPFRGTRRRRFFPDDLRVSEAEADAGRRALADAGVRADEVDVLLVQSFLPDELQPKNAGLVAHQLGITKAAAWEVDSICSSALSQMTVGASLVHSGVARHVLCVQSCAYSRVNDPSESSSIQVADMASAFVLGPSPGTEMATAWETDGSIHSAIRLKWMARTDARPRRWWEKSPDELLIDFSPLQERVNGEIARHARTVTQEALRRADTSLGDLDLFITHQPMAWFRAFMEDELGLPEGLAFDTFEEYANVNSASIPASIHEARRAGRIEPGSRVLLFCPAAGYTYGAVTLRWGDR